MEVGTIGAFASLAATIIAWIAIIVRNSNKYAVMANKLENQQNEINALKVENKSLQESQRHLERVLGGKFEEIKGMVVDIKLDFGLKITNLANDLSSSMQLINKDIKNIIKQLENPK